MNDFNKMFIDTEELQSEITKLKNSIINSLTEKNTADTEVVKTDLANIKSDLAAVKMISNTSSKSVTAVNTKINEVKSNLPKKIEEIVTNISNVESTSVNAIQIINAANKTSNEETNTKINNVNQI